MKSLLCSFLALVGLAAAAPAQCLSCSTSTPYAPAIAVPIGDQAHGWYATDDGKLALWWHGERIGELDALNAKWQTEGKEHVVDLVETFGLTPPPPRPIARARGCDCGPGCACADCRCEVAGDVANYGVVTERIPRQATPTYEINGQVATKAQAERYLRGGREGGTLADDRAKHFLTAVLADTERKRFLDDVASASALQPWKGKMHVNAYPPSDWHVPQIGLAEGISYQGPPDAQGRSKVLFRTRSYAGPEQLAQALRVADPGYTPDADPDPSKPKDKAKKADDKGLTLDSIDPDAAGNIGAGALALLSVIVAARRRFGV